MLYNVYDDLNPPTAPQVGFKEAVSRMSRLLNQQYLTDLESD